MPQEFFAGVDIGASNVRVAIADRDGEVAARRAVPFDGSAPGPALERIGRTIDELVRGVWASARLSAIGVAMPGTIDPARGLVASAANMPGWGDVDVAAALGGPRGAPVAVENDANAAAVGEGWLGAARGKRHHVFVALGTGIGCGVVIDGKLHRGAHFLGGEVAFFPMTREQVRTPGWDNGLEALVGGRAIAATAARMLGDSARPADLFDAAYAGEASPAAWLAELQEHLAMALVQIGALLDPEIIVVGGGVAVAQGERLLGRVRELAHSCLPVKVPIVLSELGADAQIIGALRLAVDRVGV